VDEKTDGKCFTDRVEGMKDFYFIPKGYFTEQTFPPHASDTWSFGMLVLDLLLITFGENYPSHHDITNINNKFTYVYNSAHNDKPTLKKTAIRETLFKGFKEYLITTVKWTEDKNAKEINHTMYVFLEFTDYLFDYLLNTNLNQIPNMKTVVQDLQSFQSVIAELATLAKTANKHRQKKPINKSSGDRINFNNIYQFGKDETYTMFIKREGVPESIAVEAVESVEVVEKEIVNKIQIDKSAKNNKQSLAKNVQQKAKGSNQTVNTQYRDFLAQYIDFSKLVFAIVPDYLETKKENCVTSKIPVFDQPKAYSSPYQVKTLKPKMRVSFNLFCFEVSPRANAGIKQTYLTWSQ
jgi:hypothetical protein